MKLIIILSLLLLLSVIAIVYMVKYIKYLLNKLVFMSQNLNDLLFTINHFSEHLKSVHEMQVFYGDETLQSLIEHSKEVERYLKSYKDIYTVTNEFEEGEYDAEEGFEESNINEKEE